VAVTIDNQAVAQVVAVLTHILVGIIIMARRVLIRLRIPSTGSMPGM
jgi:hypothetical protein